MNETTLLETDRLLFRRFVPEDLDDLFALYQDPEVVQHIPDVSTTLEETGRELEWHRNGPPGYPDLGLWATIQKDTGRFIGRCGLLPWTIDGRDEVEVAFLFERAAWGQGFGTEAGRGILRYAREQLGIARLVCLVEHDNDASKRVAEKIGMAFEKEAEDEHGPFLLYATP